jgi:DNA polymerase I-like protein with 3'-5' exonuclease and polymerase domains
MVYFVTNRAEQNMVSPNKRLAIIDSLPTVSPFAGSNYVGLDLETTGLVFNRNEILLIVLGNENDQYVIDWYGFKDSVGIASFFDTSNRYIGHNLLFDLPFLMHRGVSFSNDQIYDTMIAEQVLIKGTKKSASLKESLGRRLKITDIDKDIRMEFVKMHKFVPQFDNRHIEYAASDVKNLFNLRGKQMEHLIRFKQVELTELNNKNVVVSARMKVNGMMIDGDKWVGLYKQMQEHTESLEIIMDKQLEKHGIIQRRVRNKKRAQQIDMFGGNSVEVVNKNVLNINYASPSQCLGVFKALGLPIPKSAKEDKKSVGEATLQQYLISYPDTILKDFIETLIDYKISVKLSKSFGKKWLDKNVDERGRIHATFAVNSTSTGRYKCSSPNLQQIPSNVNYRQCFIAPKGRKIWTCDYSSAELRILASLSRDSVMLGILSQGGDLHSYAATPVLRYLRNADDVIVSKKENADFRTSMKNVIFGLLYGAGTNKIAELLDISKFKAEKVYDILTKTFPSSFEYLEKMSRFGVSNGYIVVDEKLNQRRWFEAYFDNEGYLDRSERGIVERASKNTPIQATNGQMMKTALLYVDEYIQTSNLSSFIVSTVHDEMVVEVGQGEEEHCLQFENLMKRAGDEFLDGVQMEVESKLLDYWSK